MKETSLKRYPKDSTLFKDYFTVTLKNGFKVDGVGFSKSHEYSEVFLRPKFTEEKICPSCKSGKIALQKVDNSKFVCSACGYTEDILIGTYFEKFNVNPKEIIREIHTYSESLVSGAEYKSNVLSAKLLDRITVYDKLRDEIHIEITNRLPELELQKLIHTNPWHAFQRWLTKAMASDLPNPNAFTLATSNAAGELSARIVLLKMFSEELGFVFFTNFGSRKSLEIKEIGRASCRERVYAPV